MRADHGQTGIAAAFSLAATAGGSVKAIKTTPLLSVDQGITAMKRADEIGRNYHPPVPTSPAHTR